MGSGGEQFEIEGAFNEPQQRGRVTHSALASGASWQLVVHLCDRETHESLSRLAVSQAGERLKRASCCHVIGKAIAGMPEGDK